MNAAKEELGAFGEGSEGSGVYLRDAVHGDLVVERLAERALGAQALGHVVTELRVGTRRAKGWVSAMTGIECERRVETVAWTLTS